LAQSWHYAAGVFMPFDLEAAFLFVIEMFVTGLLNAAGQDL
jgi:hypothetical protein